VDWVLATARQPLMHKNPRIRGSELIDAIASGNRTTRWRSEMIVMTKHSPAELRPYLEGSENLVALNGGYLYIYQGDDLLHIASIPSPNLLGDRTRDTIIDNIDEFQDSTENEYTIIIYSSSVGIEWVVFQIWFLYQNSKFISIDEKTDDNTVVGLISKTRAVSRIPLPFIAISMIFFFTLGTQP
jgi:hypothetical protein